MSLLLRLLGFCLAAFIGGCVVWVAASYGTIRLPNAHSHLPMAILDFTYSDFITIMLTCVTVVLAAVGIGVGVVAAYTIRNLREDADLKVDVAVRQKLAAIDGEMNEKIASMGYSVGRKLKDGRKLKENDNLDEEMEDR